MDGILKRNAKAEASLHSSFKSEESKCQNAGERSPASLHGYNQGMTVYVTGYRLEPREEEPATTQEPKQRLTKPPEYEIHYSEKPEYVAAALEFADKHCDFLNAMQVRVGQHYCQFEVEKLDEDKFAVVCRSHPGLART